MKSKKLHLGRFSIAVLMASILATLPTQTAGASESAPRVQVKTLTIHVDAPLPGQAIQLPDTVPAAVRSEVLALLEHTPPGQAVVIAPPEVQNQYAALIQQAVQDAGVTLASPSSGPVAADDPVPIDGGPNFLIPVLGWIIVILVIIVIIVIIYVVWKISQLIPPPPSTNPPPSINPAVAFRPMVDGASLTPQLAGTLSCTSGFTLDIQANTDLNTSNWWTLATLATEQAVTYTNGVTNVIWAVVTARDTNGTVLCSALVTGTDATNTLVGDRPLKIPYPGPDPDKLFLRLRAK